MLNELIQQLLQGTTIHITIRIERNQEPEEPDPYRIECERCGWSAEHPTEDAAKRALRAHQSLHCTVSEDIPAWLKRNAGTQQEQEHSNGDQMHSTAPETGEH